MEFRQYYPTPYHASADFDGNGIQDHAWMLFSEKNDESWALFVFLGNRSGKPSVIELDRDDGRTAAQRLGIRVAEPGTYKTVCGRRNNCQPGEPEKIELVLPGIFYVLFESAVSIYFWDRNTATFKRVWLGD